MFYHFRYTRVGVRWGIKLKWAEPSLVVGRD